MTIQDTIRNYKERFSQFWEEEKYKWIAVKHYRDHWDIEVPVFLWCKQTDM